MMVPLIQGLADRNHSVTFLTNFPTAQFRENDNIREIIIDGSFFFSEEKNLMNFFDIALNYSFSTQVKSLGKLKALPGLVISKTLEHVQVQEMLHKDNFDLILVAQQSIFVGYPLAWHFKSPFIVISPHVLFGNMGTKLGDSEHTEHAPFIMLPYTDHMTLVERMTVIVLFLNPMWSIHNFTVCLR